MASSKMRKTAFSIKWCDNEQYLWVKEVPTDKFSAYCSLCKTKFSLSNMGKTALISHMNGKKHRELINNKNSSFSLLLHHTKLSDCVSTKTAGDTATATTVTSKTSATSSTNRIPCAEITPNLNQSAAVITDSNTSNACSKSCSAHCNMRLPFEENAIPKPKGLQNFIARDTITKVEMCCLDAVMHHKSLRDIQSGTTLMKMIFSDSAIAKGMQLSKTKAAYTITYGISRYFKSQLATLIEQSDTLVIAFDESLNKVCQQQQMDIVVRFWDKTKNEVSTMYFTSAFLGHTTANDLLEAFKGNVPVQMLQKMIQVSMDGPNVNFKFLRNLREYLSEDPNNNKLLDLGSCGLHTLHCAFKAGIRATEWQIIEFLRAIYNLFKNVPARKAEYINASGSKEFPLKFCAIR